MLSSLVIAFLPRSAVAATKLLQSCRNMCDLRDDSPPGSSVHGIFQARVLEWVLLPSPSKECLLISWLQSPSAVILEPQKRRSVPVSTVSPSIFHEVMGPDAMIFVF